MKAALALIFFACIAGSMAANAGNQLLGNLVQQGQAVAQTVLGNLQQQILSLVQNAVGQLSSLVGSIGGRFDFSSIGDQLSSVVSGLVGQLLGQVLGGITGLIGGRGSFDLGALFSEFLQQITTPITQVGQHLLNQGLAAVLGGLGGSRGAIGDIFSSLSSQVGVAVTAAQGALQGALSGLSALGSNLVDASKPHFQQLQEQLLGHGLNVLGSISETVNNLHGTITGGR